MIKIIYFLEYKFKIFNFYIILQSHSNFTDLQKSEEILSHESSPKSEAKLFKDAVWFNFNPQKVSVNNSNITTNKKGTTFIL